MLSWLSWIPTCAWNPNYTPTMEHLTLQVTKSQVENWQELQEKVNRERNESVYWLQRLQLLKSVKDVYGYN
jgi:hypothetical protein